MKKSYSITQEQFNYIVVQCDAILEKNKSVFSIVGIAWLNVLHSHPSIRARYVRVFYKRSWLELVRDILHGTGILLTDIFLSFITLFKKNEAWTKLPSETEVLFISHLLNAETPKNAPDFYFQDLPDYLEQKHYHTAVGLMNHVNGFKAWEANLKLTTVTPVKFVLPLRLSFGKELLLIGRSIKTAAFFFKQYLQEKEPLKKSFLFELSGNTLSAHTMRAYRLYETVRFLISHTNIRVVAFTWEGHSWERMVCHAAKATRRKVLAIGYQHTILFPSSHALRKSVGSEYDPDIILAVGSVTKDILAASPDLDKVKIETYGSPRLTREQVYEMNHEIHNACLVTPEGLVNECITLFTFAIDTARLMPETVFIFRTHPAISFADLQKEDTRLQDLPNNVLLSSNKNLEDDFKRCSWLLYRNSSVSFFAIMAGLRPIYLRVENEISNDVLYALTSWRKQVSVVGELKIVIDHDKQTSEENRSREREEAYRFSKAYMVPYDVTIFEACINGEFTRA